MPGENTPIWIPDAGFHLVVPWKTGIWWTTQVGGTACGHPVIEGFVIPLDSDFGWADPLEGHFKDDRPMAVTTAMEAIQRMGFDNVLELREDEYGISEAWIPVRIKDDIDGRGDLVIDSIVKCFPGSPGLDAWLTYPNSD